MEFTKHISTHTYSQWTLCKKYPYKKKKTQKKIKNFKVKQKFKTKINQKKFLDQINKIYFR